MLAEAQRQWLDERAEALDAGDAQAAAAVVPWLARERLLHEGNVPDAIEAISQVAAHSLSAAFVFWGQRVLIHLLQSTGNELLRARWLPLLLAGEHAGASGLSNVMKFLSGIESLAIRAEPDGEGWVLHGRVPWCTNLRPGNFIAAAAVSRSDGQPPMVVALPWDRAGLARSPDLDLIALRGTHTAALALDGVRIGRDDLLAGQGGIFLPQVRPAFLGLQCGLSIGLARAALAQAERNGAARAGLAAAVALQQQALADAVDELKAGVADGRFVDAPHRMFELRLALHAVVQQATQLELQAGGGRLYHRDQPGGFARRWRESAFIPIVTPSVTQLQGELARRAARLAAAA